MNAAAQIRARRNKNCSAARSGGGLNRRVNGGAVQMLSIANGAKAANVENRFVVRRGHRRQEKTKGNENGESACFHFSILANSSNAGNHRRNSRRLWPCPAREKKIELRHLSLQHCCKLRGVRTCLTPKIALEISSQATILAHQQPKAAANLYGLGFKSKSEHIC